MSAAKKQKTSVPPAWKDRGIFWLFGSGRPLLISLVLLGAFFGAWYAAWRHVERQVLTSSEYFVAMEQIEVTPPPKWIHRTDIRADAFLDLTRDGQLNIMDDNLVDLVARSFARHPCVSKVHRVTKQNRLPLVKVELTYREPVCVVETPGRPLPVPVDAEGVLLPSDDFADFSPLELLAAYPRLVGIQSEPPLVGRRWYDASVIGGAEIAAVLAPVWKELKLNRIVPHAAQAGARMQANATAAAGGETSRPSEERVFSISTASGTSIYWGHSPMVAAGELSAPDKIGKLQHYFASHNDSFDGPHGPQQLDIRTMQP